MAMAVTAIRFSQDEREWISSFADLNGLSFSAQVRDWVLDRLEDELDARDLAQAIEESRNDPTDVGITIEEAAKYLGLE